MRVFAYIAQRYNSAAESTSLLSSVASLATNPMIIVASLSSIYIRISSRGRSHRARKLVKKKKQFQLTERIFLC